MRLSHLCFVTVALTTGFSTTGFAEERRELGAHVHGHGTLNMAVEGKTVALELRVPGADIVGFEHEAKTDADKAALKQAEATLSTPGKLFAFEKAAGCKLTGSEVHFSKDDDHNEHHGEHSKHEDHDRAAHKHEHHDEHEKATNKEAHHGKHSDHDDHGHHDGEAEEHAEFHAEYKFACAAPEKLTAMTFDYFKTFKNAKELAVNVVTAKGQSTYEVTADKPTLSLNGLM